MGLFFSTTDFGSHIPDCITSEFEFIIKHVITSLQYMLTSNQIPIESRNQSVLSWTYTNMATVIGSMANNSHFCSGATSMYESNAHDSERHPISKHCLLSILNVSQRILENQIQLLLQHCKTSDDVTLSKISQKSESIGRPNWNSMDGEPIQLFKK